MRARRGAAIVTVVVLAAAGSAAHARAATYTVGTTSGHETVGGPSWTGGEDNNIEAGGALMVRAILAARAAWPK